MLKAIMNSFKGLAKNEKGQALPEYALVIFLVAIVAIGALTTLGGNIQALLDQIAAAL